MVGYLAHGFLRDTRIAGCEVFCPSTAVNFPSRCANSSKSPVTPIFTQTSFQTIKVIPEIVAHTLGRSTDLLSETVVNFNLSVAHVPRITDRPSPGLGSEHRLEEYGFLCFNEVGNFLHIDGPLPVNVYPEKVLQRLVPANHVRRRGGEHIERRNQDCVLCVLVVNHIVNLVGIDVRHVLIKKLMSLRCLREHC